LSQKLSQNGCTNIISLLNLCFLGEILTGVLMALVKDAKKGSYRVVIALKIV